MSARRAGHVRGICYPTLPVLALLAVLGALFVTPPADAQMNGGRHQWDGMATAEFVAMLEGGAALEPYHDPVGYPTICVGHLLSREQWADLSQWQPMTRRECMALFDGDLQVFREAVDRAVHSELNANQETALVSLAYNIGTGAFSRSQLVMMIDGDAPEWLIVLEWLSWDKVREKGRLVVSPGLLARRRAEVTYFHDSD